MTDFKFEISNFFIFCHLLLLRITYSLIESVRLTFNLEPLIFNG
ncbi:MAG TPA: hypothetical protein VF779_08485 [Pyrinomonadaceae bacterium]